MLIDEILDIYRIIEKPNIDFDKIYKLFSHNPFVKVTITKVDESKKTKPPIGGGITHFIKINIKDNNKNSPTLGIIGQLGGVGARPEQLGFVSDGDGALVTLSVALKIIRMKTIGENIKGNFIFTTHLSSHSPTAPHKPVPFMGSPVSLETMNKFNVDKNMDAILSIDTTRGNKIINNNYFAITPTIKEGWILKVNENLLNIMEWITGQAPAVVPITMQDITPYGNEIYHINSILQPATVTKAPVIGIALTSKKVVPGSATEITNLNQIDMVSRFVYNVAKIFGKKELNFYDEEEFKKIKKKYGSMIKLYRK